MLIADHRQRRRRPSASGSGAPAQGRAQPDGSAAEQPSRSSAGAEDGFMLVEVIISALLVAIIVVATFNGFDAASRLSADQRRHAEAALLAAESQEKLRTDPAAALDALESASHTYTREVGGTKFKITQTAKPISGGGAAGCSVNESSRENGANIQITSSVTWFLLEERNSPPVKQSSIITPPVGSALEVDVSNGGTPKLPAAGVTASAKFTPVGSGSTATAEGTTGSAGCVVLTGLATTSATVEIVEKPNFVTTGGDLKYPLQENVSIAPNLTTQLAVSYDEGGRITAEYTYKGETSWEGQPVTGNTFVVFNESIPAGDPKFQTGSQEFKYQGSGEENYEAVTTTSGTTASTAANPAKYAKGDLFPFSTTWGVYGGDCPKNGNYPEAKTAGGIVTPGGNTVVKVPLSYVNLTVSQGTVFSPGAIESTPAEALFTNVECEGYELPNNAFAASLVHSQTTNSSGHLGHPFQPFGKEKLCVYDKAAKRTYTSTFTNSETKGTARNVYFGQISKAEREAEEAPPRTQRAKEESEASTAKTKREKEETEATAAREAREKAAATEASNKTTREAKEKSEREKWLEEESKKFISKAQREAKETTQKTNRTTAENNEKAAAEKRATEEAAAITAKEKRATEEAEAKTAKEKRETEETEANTARTAREKEEKEAEEKTGFTVASGKTSC
jgi:Tfp pilus assembly protein PilV